MDIFWNYKINRALHWHANPEVLKNLSFPAIDSVQCTWHYTYYRNSGSALTNLVAVVQNDQKVYQTASFWVKSKAWLPKEKATDNPVKMIFRVRTFFQTKKKISRTSFLITSKNVPMEIVWQCNSCSFSITYVRENKRDFQGLSRPWKCTLEI